ncbi:helix-turn-helix domain-containing protein [Hyphomicrobium zavarzinii]|uniref:helix-turn-helix domain-containing protein n=1 Tax=Hyphomicrobium zavarzinii TaxID=48292 RepID=UPI00039E17B1|nr:XRE family transcriptional regulator [Hyphomicrobium zavarzinii]
MLGNRLKIARKKAGLSLRALAEQVDPPVSAQALSKYESNQMVPSSRVLVGLAKALGTSLDYLMSGQVAELEGVEFRKHSGTSAQDRARVEAIVTERLERYFAVEDVLGLPDEADPFARVRTDRVASLEEAECLADQVRDDWDLGNDAIPSMCGLLEDKGIKVIEADLPERVSGMACHVRRSGRDNAIPLVVVSSSINTERKRFTLAHELGHRVIRGTASDELKLEKAIDRFAGAFLVPADHLRQEIGECRHGVAYQEIKRLKHYYGVSASSMLMRLLQVGILSESVVAYAFRTTARSWRTEEPDPIKDGIGLGDFEKPRRFERLVYRALAEKLISPIRAAELISKPLSEVEIGLRGPQGS